MDSYKETFNSWNKVAKLYQDKFMHLDLYDDTYDIFCEKVIIPNAAILEIGCGPGNITSYLLKKRPDFKIEGIDFAPNMIALAKVNNPTAVFQVMDCREIDILQKKYDAVVCGFCIPYLSETDCLKFIKDCAGLLSDEGVIYISFVEGDYSHSGFQTGSSGDRVYFHFHSLEVLTRTLNGCGFKIFNLFHKSYKKTAASDEIHTVIVAAK